MGDGARFCGRGLIQVTGRANYGRASQALFGDDRLLKTPELLEQPEWAAKSAVWFWTTRNLNALADADRFTDITRAINGGTNGLEDRKARYQLALSVLK
ncbi:Chitinase class I [compost metagenome]